MSEPFQSLPSLSIAILTCRRPALLAACLDSLVKQMPSDGSVEILVVDNDAVASAKHLVSSYESIIVRYLHEPNPGVVHARNRAVRESSGAYLAFIDDDEVACAGWVSALVRHAGMGVDASFGRVHPRLEKDAEKGLENIVTKIYTRDLLEAQDADVSDRWAYLGTGNSLFAKQRCFVTETPLDVGFNGSGGEDTCLIRSLTERGLVLRWNPAAAVEEQVPAARLTRNYLARRRFGQGQIRVANAAGAASKIRWLLVLFWMSVGGIQLVTHGTRAACLWIVRSPKYNEALVSATGGYGKILWWLRHRQRSYAGSVCPLESPRR